MVSSKVSAPSNLRHRHVTHGVGLADTISPHLKEASNITLTRPPAISDCSETVDLASFKPMFVLKSEWETHKNDKDKD